MEPTSRPFSSEDLFGHAEFLQRLARSLLSDRLRAEDAVQDAFVAALERPPRDASAPRSWLATVVRNLARNQDRSEQRRRERERRAARPERHEADETVAERLEVQRAVFDAVLALDEPKRTAIYLRYYDGLTPVQIAERLGAPVKTVKTRLNRSLAELRGRLDERFGGDRRAWILGLAPIARGSAMAGGVSAVLWGVLMAKKLGLVAGAILVGLVAWRTLSIDRKVDLEDGAMAQAAPANPAVATSDAQTGELSAPPSTSRQSARQPVEKASTGCTLVVHLRWESDGKVAAGVGLDARCANDPAPREQRVRAWTDASGAARFENLVAGPVELRLDRAVRFQAQAVAGEVRDVELVVPTGFDLRGRVVSSSGAAVAGAAIWVEELGSRWPEPWTVATSSADGAFFARSLGPRLRIGARSSAHRPSASFHVAELPSEPTGLRTVGLVVEEGGQTVGGRVLDSNGRPVANALVWIGLERMSIETASGGGGETSGHAAVTTNEQGEFVAPGRFGPGAQEAVVLAQGFPVWRRGLEILEEAPTYLDVQLEPSASISGRVIAPSGVPVEGAEVRVSPLGDRLRLQGSFALHALVGPSPRATTNASGRFTVDWVGSGTQMVSAAVPDHPELGRASVKLLVKAGEGSTCEVRLDPGQSIEGHVVDEDGLRLPGCLVQAVPAKEGIGSKRTKTDDRGRFRFFNMGESEYSLYASGPEERDHASKGEISARPGDRELEIVIVKTHSPLASVEGILLDVDGQVPSDASALLHGLEGGTTLLARCDPGTGVFRWDAVTPGRYVVQALRSSSWRTLAKGEPFEVEGGMIFDAGTLRIPRTGGLDVRASIDIEWSSMLERDGYARAMLVKNGDRFRADDLAPGTWWLRTRKPEWFIADRPIEIRSGETTTMELEALPGFGATLALDVADEIRETSDLTIEIHDATGALLWREREEDEGWRAAWSVTLPAGQVVIDAWTSTGQRGQAEAVIGPGMTEPIELNLR